MDPVIAYGLACLALGYLLRWVAEAL